MCTQHPPITRHTLEEGFIFIDIESSIDIESLTVYELYGTILWLLILNLLLILNPWRDMICIVISYPIDIKSLAGYELYGTKPCLLILNPDGILFSTNISRKGININRHAIQPLSPILPSERV